jgi:hypothetical protein
MADEAAAPRIRRRALVTAAAWSVPVVVPAGFGVRGEHELQSSNCHPS